MPNLYKLQNDAKPGELGGPPLIVGSALRFPSYTYPAWDITPNPRNPTDYRILRELSLTVYQDEFAETSPAWMESVVEAAKRGGIGNRPQLLRDAVGDAAAKLTAKLLKKKYMIDVLDVGCGSGGSLLSYLDALGKLDRSYPSRVILTGVDLSRQSLWKAVDDLGKKNRRLFPIHSRDFDMAEHVDRGSQDIVINVAGIHANAYLNPSMRAISRVLNPKGYFVSGDWHHARWEHPSYTYQLFDEMDPDHFEWKNKGEFMDEFVQMFSKAKQKLDLSSMDPADIRAIKEIGDYWRKGWAEVRLEKIKAGILKQTDEQILAEGHRPVEQYIEEGRRYRLVKDHAIVSDGIMKRNPQQVVEGTNLNMLLVLKKEN